MDEDELRLACRMLMVHLVRSQEQVEHLVGMVQEAAADGYRIGYGDAVADRALRIPQEISVGVEEGALLH
jgi:hypothetical protein